MFLSNYEKNTNPRMTVIFVSYTILKILENIKVVTFAELKAYVEQETSPKVGPIIPLALSFLFLAGKVEYIQEIDSFKRVENET